MNIPNACVWECNTVVFFGQLLGIHIHTYIPTLMDKPCQLFQQDPNYVNYALGSFESCIHLVTVLGYGPKTFILGFM